MSPRKKPLQNRVAIITGAGSGIGRATALQMAAQGASVIVAERRPRAGQATEQAIRRNAGSVRFLETDVTEPTSVTRMVRRTLRRFGRVDILVNNAGTLHVAEVIRTPVTAWRRVLEVNLTGPFLCTRAVLPAMLRQRAGTIINVASQLGKETLPEFGAYCASKFGLIGFTSSLAQEVTQHGVRVYAVCPGPVDTPLLRRAFPDAGSWEDLLQPDDVARAIVDLAIGRRRLESGALVDVTRALVQSRR